MYKQRLCFYIQRLCFEFLSRCEGFYISMKEVLDRFKVVLLHIYSVSLSLFVLLVCLLARGLY